MSQPNKLQKYRYNSVMGNNAPAHTHNNNVNSPKDVKNTGGRGQEQTRGYGRERKPPNNSKKGYTPANHLLNYSLTAPKPLPYSPPSPSFKQSWVQKERFLQANFQFTVCGEALLTEPVTPDYLAKWHYIKQVTLSSTGESHCPICLEFPTAPKITKCGHIFCWPCLLHYFNATFSSTTAKNIHCNNNHNNDGGYQRKGTSNNNEKLRRSAELVRRIGDMEVDQMYKKCPFCSELFSLAEIKSVHILPMRRYQEGDEMEMTLLKRNKHSTIPIPIALWKQKLDFRFPSSSSPHPAMFSRFHVEENEKTNHAGYSELELAIMQREKEQILSALLLTSPADTDKLFLDLALLQIQTILDRIPSTHPSTDPPLINSQGDGNEKGEGKDQSQKPHRVLDPHAPAFIPSCNNSLFNNNTTDNDSDNNNNNCDDNVNNITLNNDNRNEVNNNVSKVEEGDYVYFYQEKEGLKMFLHPICSKALIMEYGSYANFPPHITAKILQLEEITVDEYIRKRYKFLSHLPLSTICYFCEVEMKNLVSAKTLKSMGGILKERKMARQRMQMEREREQAHTPLYIKPSIDWANSPPLSFDYSLPSSVESDQVKNGEGEEGEDEEIITPPQWVRNSSSLSLSHLKSSPFRLSPSYPNSSSLPSRGPSSSSSVGDGEEDADEVPDYSQSFFDSISSLPLPSSSQPSKKKKKQNKVLFFDTSQKRSYKF